MPMTFKVSSHGAFSKSDIKDIKDTRRIFKITKDDLFPMFLDTYDILAYEALAKSASINRTRIIKIAAIFFDRVCSRTPMDEDYRKQLVKEDGEKVYIQHKADKEFCRLRWELKIGPKTFTSYELWRSKNSLFENYNDSSDIDYIFDYLWKNLENTKLGDLKNLEFINTSKYFDYLEFGEYKQASSEIASGRKYEHGLQNHHSVQAPNGMSRLTLAELDRIASSTATRSLERRFRGQRTSKVLSGRQLASLTKALGRGKSRFTLDDIQELLGARAGKEE